MGIRRHSLAAEVAEVVGIRLRPRPVEAEALVPGLVRVVEVLRARGLLRVRLRPW